MKKKREKRGKKGGEKGRGRREKGKYVLNDVFYRLNVMRAWASIQEGRGTQYHMSPSLIGQNTSFIW